MVRRTWSLEVDCDIKIPFAKNGLVNAVSPSNTPIRYARRDRQQRPRPRQRLQVRLTDAAGCGSDGHRCDDWCGHLRAPTGQIAELAGGWFPVIFIVAAVVAGFSAVPYIKLSNDDPSAGGIAMYLTRADGEGTVAAGMGLLMYFSMVINEVTRRPHVRPVHDATLRRP